MQTPSDDKVNEQPADDQRTQQLPLHATDVLDTGSDAKNSSSKIVEHAIDSYMSLFHTLRRLLRYNLTLYSNRCGR